MTDDVLTRAKAEIAYNNGRIDRGLSAARYPFDTVSSLIALAEWQAQQLADIRDACVNFTPDPSLVDAILAIIDRSQQ